MEVIKGSVGKLELKEGAGDKSAFLVVAVVEEKYAPPTVDDSGKNVWGEPELVWHNDILVRGDNAYIFRDTFAKGDQVILLGEYGKEKTVTAEDGRTFINKSFFVDSFGPDATKTRVAVMRGPKVEKAAEQAADNAQTLSFDKDPKAIEAAKIISARCNEMIDKGFMEPIKLQHLGHAWGTARNVEDAKQLIANELKNEHPAVQKYLGSVTDELSGTGKKLDWNEIVPPAPPQVAAQNDSFKQSMQNVAEIRSAVNQGY